MRVDGGLARSIFNEGVKNRLHLTSPLYVGGLPQSLAEKVQKKWHLRNTTSFIGCVNGLWLNNKRVDFENAMKKERISPGCGEIVTQIPTSFVSQIQRTDEAIKTNVRND